MNSPEREALTIRQPDQHRPEYHSDRKQAYLRQS